MWPTKEPVFVNDVHSGVLPPWPPQLDSTLASTCLESSSVSASAQTGGQGARAAKTGELASGGQDRAEQRLSEQTSQSTSRSQALARLAHTARTLEIRTLANGDSDLDFPSLHTADEDGAGSMLVGSSGELQHHVHARHAPRDARLSPPAPSAAIARPALTMEVATADAPPQDAPAALLDLPMPDAPADQDLTGLGNAFPALGDAIAFPQPGDMSGIGAAAMPDFANMAFPQPMASDERLTAFARLRFDDGSYYMHTYQILLGRNMDLARRDMRRLAKVDQLHADGKPQAAWELLNGSKGKKRRRRAARSVISEKGGIVSAPIEAMPLEYQQRRQSNASHSLSSASHLTGELGEEKPTERAPQNMLIQAFPEVPPQFDGHVPENPQDCPTVPIHPQHVTARTGSHGPKGISREHARIFYDFENGHFSIEVLGHNGLHHQDEFRYQGQIVPLDHGDHLVIGAVNIDFYLPDVALTDSQRQRQESGGSRPMSFLFENGHGERESDEQIGSDSEGEQSINPKHVYHYPVDSSQDEDDMAVEDDMDDYEEPVARRQKTTLKLKLKTPAPSVPTKESKKTHKRKYKDASPDDMPIKKLKAKHKESTREANREPVKEPKAAKEPKLPKEPKDVKELRETKEHKEPKEPKDKGKAPAKTSAKTTVKEEPPVETVPREVPVKEKPETVKPVPTDSPPLLRKPLEGELEAGGEIEGLITEEMARHHHLPASLIGQVVEKRKGPGRPPKDGIMSKRQRSQLIKQAKEIERAKAAGIDPADIPMPSMKPKVAKRKDSNAADGEDGDIRESTENGDGTLSGDRKQLKPSKPPRTPSPEPRVEDYTEEELQRPTANYVVLIHEAISSSSTGQMNLQQIYNYIEKKYPWYKFKTTTSGWQSSVRHNLGQHDAFVKGDKEGKGFNWKVNQEVSIEKERRKRQVSPPVNHAQRQPYYPPPANGYPSYSQPTYPYHPGMAPHAMAPAAPRLPPSLTNTPRLPPSMARDSNAAAPAAPQGAPRPSPYASPWAGGGKTAGSPLAQNPPTPYPQPNPQNPPVSSASAPSGQYGVLYPTSSSQSHSGPPATASPYGGPYANAGPSPYGPGPSRPYAPYQPQSQQAPPTHPPHSQAPQQHSQSQSQSQAPSQPQSYPQPQSQPQSANHDHCGRYLSNTHPDLIRQLEAFRKVYLQARTEAGEDRKVDNAIRAYVDPQYARDKLTTAEHALLTAISGIAHLGQYNTNEPAEPRVSAPANVPVTADTAAAIAADAAASTAVPPVPTHQPAPAVGAKSQASTPQPTSEPHKFTPNMTAASQAPPPTTASVAPGTSLIPTNRPSVEPLTPAPGSPAVQNGTPLRKRSFAELYAVTPDTNSGAEESNKVQSSDVHKEQIPNKAESNSPVGEQNNKPQDEHAMLE